MLKIRIPFVLLVAVTLGIILQFLFINSCVAEELEAEALFGRGKAQYSQGKFVAARLDFNEIISKYHSSPRASSAYMMLSKTLYRLGDFTAAQSIAAELRRLYPQSRYAEWTRYMIAACKFRVGETEQAISELALLVKTSNDATLKSYALNALRYSILPAMNQETFFTILAGQGITQSELESAAVHVTDEKPVSEPEFQEPLVSRSILKIGLLAPLTGEYSESGNELLKGVRAALSNYKEINGIPVELIIEDTESNPITTVLKTRRLINSGVIAIIGPVYGESTITAAMESNYSRIPFLAPTAANIGLTHIGRYVFQLNQTPVTQAEALADFTSTVLGFYNAVVIASKDLWGETVAETFSREMKQRGVKIICTEYFEPDVQVYNYNDLLMRIRNNAPEVVTTKDSIRIFNFGTEFADTVIYKPSFELIPQRLEPIDTIDCIYLSALYDDAIKIASQINEYNIKTVLLGDSGWNSENVSEELGKYFEGSYLVSSVPEQADSLGSMYFTDDFNARIRELRSITSRKGYDACAILINCLAQGARDPEKLVGNLESLRDFKGLSSRFTIDPEKHINTAVDFVHIQNGRYVKADYIKKM